MLNETAILDQKLAPGLIENPCRDRLIVEAMHVPADLAIVELGSFKGRSTGHLALGSQRGHGAKVHAFDPWDEAPPVEGWYLGSAPSVAEYREPSTREAFERHMNETGAAEYVTAHQMTAVEGAKAWTGPKVGLLFHDALHDYGSVFADLKAWLPHMARAAVVVLHDTDDPRYQVLEAAEAAFTRTKTLRERWDWPGREVVPWAKNEGKAPEQRRRGFTVVRTR